MFRSTVIKWKKGFIIKLRNHAYHPTTPEPVGRSPHTVYNLLEKIRTEELPKKLGDSPNSAGFLIRHIGDVELLFARNVFKLADVRVSAKTVIAQKDTGEWTHLQELLDYQEYAYETLKKAIQQVDDEGWDEEIETKEFERKTKAAALGRIVSHTTYHAGQLAIVLKYGK